MSENYIPKKKVDEDWKRRAQMEKERAQAEPPAPPRRGAAGAAPAAGAEAPPMASAPRPASPPAPEAHGAHAGHAHAPHEGHEGHAHGPESGHEGHAHGPEEGHVAEGYEEGALPETGFTTFMSSLAAQAMMALGQMEHPATGQPELNLDQARYLIDILRMLRDKTKGNLTAQESRQLDGLVYELEMGYVEISQAVAAGALGGGPGRGAGAKPPKR